jgi:nucleoside-diphosphate-sugar epimerase
LVYFSSIAAQVRLDTPNNYTFTEKDWNPSTEESVRNMEPSELGKISYFASKAIAERAVWEFLVTHKVCYLILTLDF